MANNDRFAGFNWTGANSAMSRKFKFADANLLPMDRNVSLRNASQGCESESEIPSSSIIGLAETIARVDTDGDLPSSER